MSTTIAVPVAKRPEETHPEEGTVAFEAARLDRLFPGWHHRINTDALDLSSVNRCILGQLDGGWADNFSPVEDDGYAGGGFYSHDSLHRGEWINEIRKRRA